MAQERGAGVHGKRRGRLWLSLATSKGCALSLAMHAYFLFDPGTANRFSQRSYTTVSLQCKQTAARRTLWLVTAHVRSLPTRRTGNLPSQEVRLAPAVHSSAGALRAASAVWLDMFVSGTSAGQINSRCDQPAGRVSESGQSSLSLHRASALTRRRQR